EEGQIIEQDGGRLPSLPRVCLAGSLKKHENSRESQSWEELGWTNGSSKYWPSRAGGSGFPSASSRSAMTRSLRFVRPAHGVSPRRYTWLAASLACKLLRAFC